VNYLVTVNRCRRCGHSNISARARRVITARSFPREYCEKCDHEKTVEVSGMWDARTMAPQLVPLMQFELACDRLGVPDTDWDRERKA
jgi:hypothetical protein